MGGAGVGRRGVMLGGLACAVGGMARDGVARARAGRAASRTALPPWLHNLACRSGLTLSGNVSATGCTGWQAAGLQSEEWVIWPNEWEIEMTVEWTEADELELLRSMSAEPVAGWLENAVFGLEQPAAVPQGAV